MKVFFLCRISVFSHGGKFLLFYVFFWRSSCWDVHFIAVSQTPPIIQLGQLNFTRQNFQEFSMSLAFLHKSCVVDFKDTRHRPTETLFHLLFNRINISLESAASTASSYSATVHFLSTLSLAFQRQFTVLSIYQRD